MGDKKSPAYLMKKNNKKRHIIGLISLALIFSVWGGQVAHGEQLLNHVGSEKTVGDRFSILDFNDIWTFIKNIWQDGSGNISIGVGSSDARTVDSTQVTFDLGGATADGVLAADSICDDATCTDTQVILEEVERGGVGQFVSVTDGATTTTITGASGTSSLDANGKTKGAITYTEDGESQLTGYKAGNAICQIETANERAHMCSEDEIVLTIRSNPTVFDSYGTVTFGWVTGGGAKYIASEIVNDCNGFLYNAGSGSPHYVGNIWKINTDGGIGSAQPCVTFTPIACCI